MRHGSLFSGIGGFDLAAQWMGWKNIFHCENNPFCKQLLNYYWPEAISYNDIKQTDFTIHRGSIGLLTGGFPCQPYSTAGKRKGNEDERHLWPEMLRAVREIQPRWIVGENVFGLINWNAGLVFDQVQTNLEVEGYQVWPYVLPACGVNAPHRRDRVYFVAYRTNSGIESVRFGGQNSVHEFETVADTAGIRPQGREFAALGWQGQGESGRSGRKFICRGWEAFPAQPPVCSRDDGFSGRLDGITFSKWRNESIKGYGNAIVPQVVLQLFKTIEQYEKL